MSGNIPSFGSLTRGIVENEELSFGLMVFNGAQEGPNMRFLDYQEHWVAMGHWRLGTEHRWRYSP